MSRPRIKNLQPALGSDRIRVDLNSKERLERLGSENEASAKCLAINKK